jgi:hypothetical protein
MFGADAMSPSLKHCADELGIDFGRRLESQAALAHVVAGKAFGVGDVGLHDVQRDVARLVGPREVGVPVAHMDRHPVPHDLLVVGHALAA